MKIEQNINKVLKITRKQAENNIYDFLNSIYAMGLVIADKDDLKDNAENISNSFIIEQYLATFEEGN